MALDAKRQLFSFIAKLSQLGANPISKDFFEGVAANNADGDYLKYSLSEGKNEAAQQDSSVHRLAGKDISN